jgi:homoserine kinase type II
MTSTASTPIEGSRRAEGFLDAEEVGRTWDLGQWKEWRRTPRGNANRSYFVTTDAGEFVARISNTRKTEQSMAAEVALLEHLCDRAFPAPQVVPTRDGQAWARVGDDLCLVTRRLPGDYADSTVPAHLAASGRALAVFHRITADLPVAARPEAGSELGSLADGPAVLDRLATVAADLLGPGADLDRFRRAADGLTPFFPGVSAALTDEPLPRALTHGSLGKSAILFDGDRLTAILDYERVAYEARIIDLAYLVRSMARNRQEKQALFLDRFGAVVRAYAAEEPLTPEEIRAIPIAIQGAALLRVRSKAANLLTKHAVVPETADDILNVLDKPLELELTRVQWLADHGPDLVAAATA